MNIHPPSSWLVGAVQCKYDLDNILLADLPANENSLTAVFELENILIEGSCSDDSNSGVPPRGLQINLGDYINPHKVDTLVMSNLGTSTLLSSNIISGQNANLFFRILSAQSQPWCLGFAIGRWTPFRNIPYCWWQPFHRRHGFRWFY